MEEIYMGSCYANHGNSIIDVSITFNDTDAKIVKRVTHAKWKK